MFTLQLLQNILTPNTLPPNLSTAATLLNNSDNFLLRSPQPSELSATWTHSISCLSLMDIFEYRVRLEEGGGGSSNFDPVFEIWPNFYLACFSQWKGGGVIAAMETQQWTDLRFICLNWPLSLSLRSHDQGQPIYSWLVQAGNNSNFFLQPP